MEMLEYCKTYSMMKSSLSNPGSSDLSLQNSVLSENNGQVLDDGSSVVVETIHRIPTRPGDFSLYHSIKRSTNDSSCETGKQQLSPLKEISRSKTMVSTVKTQNQRDPLSFESELTFAPKLNALSIKLAKVRGEKMRNSGFTRRSSSISAGDEAIFTFKPKVSSNSVKIMQNLKTTFLDRQLIHMEKQKRHIKGFVLPIQGKTRLSPVQMNRSRSRMMRNQKSKEFNNSIEEENEDNAEQEENIEDLQIDSTPTNRTDNEQKKERINEEELEKNENKIRNSNEISERKGTTTCTIVKTTKGKLDTIEKASRFKDNSPYNQSVENLYLKRQKRAVRVHQRGATYPATTSTKTRTENDGWNNSTKIEEPRNLVTTTTTAKKGNHSRSTSQPGQFAGKLKYDNPLFEKVRHAKEVAEGAIRNKRVFICHGPYPIVRATLRRRGYVEKHYSPLIKSKTRKNKTNESDDDSCDSGDDSDENPSPNGSPRGKENNSKALARTSKGNAIKGNRKSNEGRKDGGGSSGEDSCSDDEDDDEDDSEDEDWKAGYEEGGPNSEFNLMSRMVRNAVASFIWTVRRDDVDFKYLRKDQTVNHYSRAYSFTTKVGLCTNLRNLTCYEDDDHLSFFPRCHRLGVEEDKLDFIDDFRLCAAISIIKWVLSRYSDGPDTQTNLPSPKSAENDKSSSQTGAPEQGERLQVEVPKGNVLPVGALTLSLEACREFIRCREHLDIDDSLDKKPAITHTDWEQIVQHSYQLRQQGSLIANAFPFFQECQDVLNKLKKHLPQCDIDGQRNIWIVKPGAKSRGRGIMCMDRLEDILKLTGNIVGQKEGRWVVQKYIERPLLIHRVKFDIRQWFLVTDWNPLTIWFYQDCYLRFCSQNFSLEDFHVSIHLANNSVQKHFENDKVRDKRLPDENMWSSDEFKEYLKKKDLGDMWDNVIYPGMKKAVIYAVESCQEIVEYRKNSFELYGADFIIAEDYRPWLIEINCSPTMGASTGVTRKLCAQVVEDTMRVVIDRRDDKNCDIGRFELAYKQAHISAPPYIGVNLAVEGQGLLRKHGGQARRTSSSAKITGLSRPRDAKNVLNDSTDDKQREKRENSKLQSSSTRSLGKRTEGSWALGSSGQLQPSIEEKICKVVPTTRRTGNHGDLKANSQTRVSRPMTIPKAVLRYTSDSNNSNNHKSQLPISIGPDH